MADEHILTLIRAAQEAPTVEGKDEILALAHQAVERMLGKDSKPLRGGPVTFPLPIYLMSKMLGRRVEGLLFEDKSVEVDGKRWRSPSSNGLCDEIIGYHSNLWPVWKYVGVGDGKPHTLSTLRSDVGPFEPPRKKGRPER